ncbi:hypothetical protein ACVWWJ_002438 [Luteibacter sp. HA06]
MSAAELGLLAVAYGLVYSLLARGAIPRIMEVDPSYKGRWPKPSLFNSTRTSGAVVYVMFNMNLPKDDYPGPLQLRIWTARVMLWLWPFVIFLVLFFSPHVRH